MIGRRRPAHGRNSRASTMVSGRQYATGVVGTVITFECARKQHVYRIDYSKKPLHRRMGTEACRMMASWWSRSKGGCIDECRSASRRNDVKKKPSKSPKRPNKSPKKKPSKGRLLDPVAAGLAQSIAAVQTKIAQPKAELAPCEKCKKPVDKANFFCFGCKKVICNGCDTNSINVPWGGHSFEAHTREDEDEFEW